MLYIGKCRCGFLVLNPSVRNFKAGLLTHAEKSHGYEFEFPSKVPMQDLKELFVITCVRDPEEARAIQQAAERGSFWKAQRVKPENITLVSGLRSGEFKLFLKFDQQSSLELVSNIPKGE